MFFPGPKLNTLFASRWKALLWAGGVLLTAYCTVPSAEETAQDAGTTAGTNTKPSISPWARDPAPAKPAQ